MEINYESASSRWLQCHFTERGGECREQLLRKLPYRKVRQELVPVLDVTIQANAPLEI